MGGLGCEVPAIAGTTVGFVKTTHTTNVRAGEATGQWAFVMSWQGERRKPSFLDTANSTPNANAK